MTDSPRALVGRSGEQAVFDRLLEDVCAGTPRCVAVSGEPGIGKTSLVTELGRRAESRDCLVLDGRATELERDVPFGPVVAAMDAYLASLDPRAYERLATDELGVLAAVFPSLGSLRGGAPSLSTAAERFRAHHAVRELCERLAARRPLVLILEDLHWSDGATIELVGHLLRRVPDAAVLLVLTFRSGRAPAALAAAVEVASLEQVLTPVALGPLDVADAELLLEDTDPAERARLYRESGGNPFYILQLSRSDAGASAGDGRQLGPGTEGVPEAVVSAIAAELDGLPEHVRAFALAAAVCGDPFELDLALAAAGASESEALAALDDLVACDVVRPGSVPRTFRFRHPLVRTAVYVFGAPGARLAAHERADAALASWHAPAAARAHHVEQCGRRGDAEAAGVLREAARETAQRAPASAAGWLEAALRLLPGDTSAAERADLLLALAGTRAATGGFESSYAALLEALALLAEGEGAPAEVIALCAAVEHLLGRHAEARARLQASLDELSPEASADRVVLLIALAEDAFYAIDYERMRSRAAEAVAAATTSGDRPLTAAATAMLAMAEAFAGPVPDAQRHADEAAELIASMTDEEAARRLDALANLSGAAFYLDRFDEGIAVAERGLALVRSTGQGDFFPMMTQALGNLTFSVGRLGEAKDLLDAAVDSARLSGNPVPLAWGLLNRAFAAQLAGEIEDALAASAEAMALAQAMRGSIVAVWVADVHAAVLLEAGDPAAAAELLLDAGGGPQLATLPGGLRANSLEVLARALLATGRRPDAEAAAAEADRVAEAFQVPMARVFADRAAALVALDGGDQESAAVLARRAAAAAEATGAPVEAAVAQVCAARALAASGDVDGAAAELERAAERFEAAGALARRAAAERELRKLGRGVHRRSQRGEAGASGLASLTGRELEVAGLVVDRRTNAEIAGELFLSVKTVETHMRNIFRKLDVDSRVGVARVVEAGRYAQPG